MLIEPSISSATPSSKVGQDPPYFTALRARTDLETEPADAFAATTFGVFLNVTRQALTSPSRGGDRTAPSLMFEPGAADARTHRLAAMRSQDRAERLASPGNERVDTTSTSARRNARSSQAAGPSSSQTIAVQSAAQDRVVPAPAPLMADDRAGRVAMPTTAAAGLDVGTGLGKGVEGFADVEPRLTASAQAIGAQTQPFSVAPVQAPSPTSNPSQANNLAGQVGRILSTAGVGETESARAVASSPATDGARSSTAQQAKQQVPSQGRPAHANGSSQPSGEADPAKPSDFDRLVRSIRLQTGARKSTARLQLEPPELGRIRVDVRMAGDRVQIEVHTESARSRDVLYERSAELKDSLEQRGIHVDRLSVTVETPPQAGSSDPNAGRDAASDDSQAADQQRHRQSADEPVPTSAPASDETGPSEAVDWEPDRSADAEARLDIRI